MILVTGGTGFVEGHLVDGLLQEKIQSHCLVRKGSKNHTYAGNQKSRKSVQNGWCLTLHIYKCSWCKGKSQEQVPYN